MPKKTAKSIRKKQAGGSFTFRFKVLLAEKELRDGRKYTYSEVRDLTGVATSTLTDWARGDVKYVALSTLAALCVFFECGTADLLEFIPD